VRVGSGAHVGRQPCVPVAQGLGEAHHGGREGAGDVVRLRAVVGQDGGSAVGHRARAQIQPLPLDGRGQRRLQTCPRGQHAGRAQHQIRCADFRMEGIAASAERLQHARQREHLVGDVAGAHERVGPCRGQGKVEPLQQAQELLAARHAGHAARANVFRVSRQQRELDRILADAGCHHSLQPAAERQAQRRGLPGQHRGGSSGALPIGQCGQEIAARLGARGAPVAHLFEHLARIGTSGVAMVARQRSEQGTHVRLRHKDFRFGEPEEQRAVTRCACFDNHPHRVQNIG
jgi:hypothetical protein